MAIDLTDIENFKPSDGVLHPDALINLKMAEKSLYRELKKSSPPHASSTTLYAGAPKEASSDIDSLRRFILTHMMTKDIIKINKNSETVYYKIIDIDDQAILGEKVLYGQNNNFKETGRRFSVDVNDIDEILLGNKFLDIKGSVARGFLNSRIRDASK